MCAAQMPTPGIGVGAKPNFGTLPGNLDGSDVEARTETYRCVTISVNKHERGGRQLWSRLVRRDSGVVGMPPRKDAGRSCSTILRNCASKSAPYSITDDMRTCARAGHRYMIA